MSKLCPANYLIVSQCSGFVWKSPGRWDSLNGSGLTRRRRGLNIRPWQDAVCPALELPALPIVPYRGHISLELSPALSGKPMRVCACARVCVCGVYNNSARTGIVRNTGLSLFYATERVREDLTVSSQITTCWYIGHLKQFIQVKIHQVFYERVHPQPARTAPFKQIHMYTQWWITKRLTYCSVDVYSNNVSEWKWVKSNKGILWIFVFRC